LSNYSSRRYDSPFVEQLDGSLPGDRGFDPLGLSNIDDLGLDLYWLREAELKHARVAMLASFGALAQEAGLVFPGQVRYVQYSDVSSRCSTVKSTANLLRLFFSRQ
jgi:hypothetical protein